LTRRNYQQGYVYQKGRKQSDKWLSGEPAYVQFRQDIPGRPDLRHHTFALGICRTRTIAERTSAEKLEKLGINSTQHFIEATSNVTFKQQGEIWLKSLANRKRNPPEQTTIDNRRYALDKWIYPFFEGRLLADINNRAMKDFVEYISSLAPATIRDYANTVKAVVASALDENGEAMFPRKWSEEFIDAPVVKHQRQPSTDREGMEAILKEANEQYCVLYALLAGCGPMRAGEALGLEIDKHISEDCRTLYIRQKAKRGILQPYTKTRSGTEVNLDGECIGRDVDLCSPLATMLRVFTGNRKSGLLFCRPNGLQVLQRTVLKMSLHRILDNPELEKGGFNIFRRFRITHIKTSECPDFLQHFWSGHASTHVSERYTKLLKDREFRLQWAEKIGTGFTLPKPSAGLRGLLIPFRRVG